jgi:hypothetical protein
MSISVKAALHADSTDGVIDLACPYIQLPPSCEITPNKLLYTNC